MKKVSLTSLAAGLFFVCVSLLFFGGPLLSGMPTNESVAVATEPEVPPAGKGGEGYPEQGYHAGVWNGGQAVFWDLHLIDHFRYFGAPERARGYAPEQPIPFSHVTHVKQNQMECQYCHWSVTKSSYAAIPEVETCMGCHRYVNGRTEDQQKDIQKIKDQYEDNVRRDRRNTAEMKRRMLEIIERERRQCPCKKNPQQK